MVGGINTPGILIVKKHLVSQTRTPSKSGGGTVFYVTHTHHRFLSDRIERYEGGTPNIVGIFRAGLSFLVKRQISDKYRQLHTKSHNSTNHSSGLVVENGITTTDTIPKTIHEYEFQTHRYVVETLKQTAPNLIMLGCSSSDPTNDNNNCLPIFSFLIKCGHRFLHYNFVCALLNDLFGIQSRGGCQCAGPYSQHLLGLTERSTNNTKEGGGGEEVPNDNNQKFEYALLHYKERSELLRPGFTRLSLPYKGLHDEEVEYVLKALQFVAKNGWVFVSQYRCNHRTGEWRHFSRQGRPLGSERKWLSHYHFSNNLSSNDHRDSTVPEYPPSSLKDILDNALKNAEKQLDIARTDMRYISQALKMEDEEGIFGTEKHLNDLRWYVYPKECASWLKEEKDYVPATSSTELIGGIRPFGYFETPTLNKSSSTKIHHEEEKKQSSEIIDMDIENGNGEDNNNHEVVYYFRDGEYHSGEASLHEILTGYDDGELSNKCLVFFPKQNEWSTIQDIKAQFSGSKASPQSSSPVKSLTTTITLNGESKKASRDSCSWGRQPEHQISIPDQPSTIHSSETTNDNITSNRKRKNMGKITPPPKLMRYITQAMMQWDMIQDGDRLLLGLSGGKDSLSLLHCLLEYKRKLPIKFEIEVCTIDPMTPSFDPSPLIPYVESLGLKYHYIRDNIVERANSSGKNGRVVTSLCAFCARMKRGNLYNCARKNKCNKLVLAQHLDDCAESFMMSVMHNGFLRTMKANYRINAGDISVIRPLVYCRENLMTEFAKSAKLPVINENCPACFEEPKERARVKSLLKREETLYPQFYDNIRRSLIPLMHDESTAILRCYTEEAVSKSRKKYDMKIMQKKSKMDLEDKDEINTVDIIQEPDVSKSLSEFTEEELVRELARRKANTYRLSGAMKRLPGDEEEGDPLGQSCSLDGGGDCIPCRELMP
jgi:tRNA(Ile)-lysidine synthase TilS/MesJ